MKTFGDNACHSERREGSGSTDAEILRGAQDDRQDTSQARSREVLSPNVLGRCSVGTQLPTIFLLVLPNQQKRNVVY